MRLSWLKRLVVVALLMAFNAVAQLGPISLDRYSGRQPLRVLDDSGRILVATGREPDNPSQLFVQVPPNYKALDIVTAKLWGNREMMFVTAYGLTAQDSRARIIQYSGKGDRECEWMLPEVSSGLDVDPQTHIVYLSGSSTNTVYTLRLLQDGCYGSRQLNPFYQIKEARRLGPIVIASERKLAFVADVLGGTIYRLDLARGGAIAIARSLGQPVALLLNDFQNETFVADSAGRRVWRINVNTFPGPSPQVISRDPAFEEPYCLAFSGDHRLLVGDRRAKAIFTLNDSGKVASRFLLPE